MSCPIRLSAECVDKSRKDCAGKSWMDGEVMKTPLGSKWWPHPIWDEGDETGLTNWYTKQEVVMRALSQVKEGQIFSLGHPYTAEIPLFGNRKFVLRISATPTDGPVRPTNLSIMTISWPPRSVRWVRSSTDSAISACRSALTATAIICVGIIASPIPRGGSAYGLKKTGHRKTASYRRAWNSDRFLRPAG